jgi:hypothetical protein
MCADLRQREYNAFIAVSALMRPTKAAAMTTGTTLLLAPSFLIFKNFILIFAIFKCFLL